MTIDNIIEKFKTEFGVISDKFEVMRVLDGQRPLDPEVIRILKLPSEQNNIIWHPGVYVFFGNGKPYRVGRHLGNSRLRVLQHLNAYTGNDKHNIWDIRNYDDAEILLFNVKNKDDYHWVASLEIFLEKVLKPTLAIPAKRQG